MFSGLSSFINTPLVLASVFGLFATVTYYFTHKEMLRTMFIQKNSLLSMESNNLNTEETSAKDLRGFSRYMIFRFSLVFIVVAGSVYIGSQLVQQNLIDSFKDYPVKIGKPLF